MIIFIAAKNGLCVALKRLVFLLPLFSLLFLSACASPPQHPPLSELKAYKTSGSTALLNRYSPVFIVESPDDSFNLIGTPSARITIDGEEEIFVDHTAPTIYSETRNFQTAKDSYTNLHYQIHFSRVPFSLIPFHIGQGKNVGLITIVTLNSSNKPVLYTTVHTCGCYIAFVPTSYMPHDAFPNSWIKKQQSVFGETLPGFLDYSTFILSDTKLAMLIREGSHRIKDLWLTPSSSLIQYDTAITDMQPITSLTQLPLEDKRTSFYETHGPRKGYVKGSHKPWERLLMSWWAFDWRIGEDKKLGRDKGDGVLFYTSLKPWSREASDLRDFANFLSYWGWRL